METVFDGISKNMPEKKLMAMSDFLLDMNDKDFNTLYLAIRLAYPRKDARVQIMANAAKFRKGF
jgi:hypothetical protein